MKNLTKILGLSALILFSATADAQLGGKLKKFGKKAAIDKATKPKAEEPAAAAPASTTTAAPASTAKAAPAAEKKAMELDWTTFRLKPAITMSSLLYATSVHKGGGTRFSGYTASFVPYKKADGSTVSSIYDQGEYLKIKVYKGETFLDYFEYDGGTTFDNNKLRKFNVPSSRYKKNGEWASGSNIDLKKHGVGNYRLEFLAGGKVFYNFDFEVYKVTNDDAYADLNEMYLSRGAWNKYAWMEQQKSGNMVFGFYLQHEVFKPNAADARKTTMDVSWTLNITKDGKPFATQYDKRKPKKSKVKRAEWTDVTTAMKTADATKVIQLPSFTDGAYKIEVKVDNEKAPRIYKFTVANNKIVYMDEQDRSKNTDPTRLVEGWNNFWWFKQEGK